ncbi:hypothetical protein SLEP1_g37180 [Rubroshorea leprosula]|uniref:Uncharacterized protein n=1 Tax=Rubroshorea leprosula TaxID=152421 RepID=A0AAV5KTV8_9ROSI|nr:hypothetical protein SLEP1_g37180 [Rubroshorea leprosula]
MASSYHQPKGGGQKIQLGEHMRKLRVQFDDLKNTKEELVQENESFKSEITALEQKIERLRKLKENMPMDIDSPKDMDSLVDPMEIDLPEGKV